MKYKLFVVFLCLRWVEVTAQVVFQDKNEKTDSSTLMQMYHEAIKVLGDTKQSGYNIEQLDIVEIEDEKYLIANGLFYVYHWENGHWKSLYKGSHHGFNYGCKVFIHKGEIYAFGGYGFWRRHGMLVKFLMDRAEWELIPITSDLEFFYAWQNSAGLHAFNNTKTIDIDIDNQKIIGQQPLIDNQISMPLPLHWYTLEFENYYYVNEQIPFIINKTSHQIFITKQLPFNGYYHNTNSLAHIYGDSLTYFKNSMSEKYTMAVKNELKYFKSHEKEERSNIKFYTLLGACILILSIGGVYYKIRKNKVEVVEAPHNWNNKTLELLLIRKGEILSVEALDILFEIQNIIPAETQRYKRSSMIKEINGLYQIRHKKDLIVRKPDPEDGRKFVYAIEET